MAFNQWILNQAPATGAEAIFNLKAMLKLAGWVVQSSGDATSYFAASDGITTAGSGAGGMNNANAWFRIQDPGAVRELVVQRGSTSRAFWIRSSKSAKFVGGAPSATVAPTATDQQNEWGTIATGTTLPPVDATYRQQGGADSASPYGWWTASYPTGGGDANFGLVYEPLVETDAADTDPIVMLVTVATLAFTPVGDIAIETASSTVSGVKGYIDGTNFVSITGCTYGSASGTIFPGASGTNPHSTKDDAASIMYARRSALTTPGYKGKGTVMRWEGTTRSEGDTKSAKTRICFGNVTLPWDGVTTPTI